MEPEELRARTKAFAVQVIRFVKTTIPSDAISAEIARQLTRAGGSTAAGYRAVCRARTRKDFIYKLGNTIEEVDEAALWLEVLIESGITPSSESKRLWREADELTRILVASRETARRNQRAAEKRVERRR